MTTPFLFADRPDQIARVRGVLDDAGYSSEGVRAVMGEEGFTFLSRGELAPVLRRTRGGTARETLIRLFLCGVDAPFADAERALAPVPVKEWAAAGLVSVDGSSVRGGLKLRPYEITGQRWILGYDSAQSGRHGSDYVLGIGAASMTLAGMTVRPPIGSFLDLGTGGGVQSLHALAHAERIVATDLNPRAVAMAKFNFALNDVRRVTVRQGDLFEPVAGERFDLIVSNPPFVISPEARFDYRDSGLPLDEICQRIVAQAAVHLEKGGWCQLLANWAHLAGGDWQARLEAWFQGTGCNAWIIQREVQDVERYASTWIRHEERDPSQTGEAFNTWMDFYHQAGVEAVGFGLITMQQTDRPAPWVRIDELNQDVALPCGDAIAATFGRLDWLADRGGGARRLLDQRLTVAGDVRLFETRRVTAGRWMAEEDQLRQLHGLRYTGSIDPSGAGVVAGCDGRHTLRELVQRLADSIGADFADVAPQAEQIVTRLIEQGFLLPEA